MVFIADSALRTHCARVKEIRSYFRKIITFQAAVDVNKYNYFIHSKRTACAVLSELPSYISIMIHGSGDQNKKN